jgi:flagellar hook-associated protein 1 FlgK
LNIGASGLNAAAHGQNVTGQNISNATTEGYTRRITNLEPIPLQHGGGVRANGSSRVQDQYLERRSLNASAGDGEAKARVETLSVLDQTFSEGPGSIGAALDAFDTAIADFSTNPSVRANRQAVLSKAEDLSRAFNTAANELAQARTDANGRIQDSVRQVNQNLDQIGSLSAQIVLAKANGNEAGDLEDRRDTLIRQVAASVPVNVIYKDNGAVTMQLGGARTLVAEDSSVHHLEANLEPTSGDVRIYRQTAGAMEDITSFITTGTIGGAIAARDGALTDARNALDQLATDVANAYNSVHSAGFGLDGAGARNLFAVPPAGVTGAAASFAVSTDVAGQPDLLAGATDPLSVPGDNRNAIELLHVRDQNLATGGTQTMQQAYRALVSDAGTALQSANNQSAQTGAVLSQVENLRASASGVNTDEEMISLMKFQRAYQASLRVIETADQMLDDLLNLRR